jgi:Secretion system C-terminal sorting domain
MGNNNSTTQAASNTKMAEETGSQFENSMSSVHKTGLYLYPNPAKETVILNMESGNYNLRVSNAIGQTIFEQNTEGVLSINVATWTNGMYLFEVTDKTTNKRQRSKIVVQH